MNYLLRGAMHDMSRLRLTRPFIRLRPPEQQPEIPEGRWVCRDRGPRRRTVPRIGHVPGIRFIVAGLYLSLVIACRSVVYAWGVPLPLRLVSQIGNLLVFSLIAIGACKFASLTSLSSLYTKAHRAKLAAWASLLIVLAVYGWVRGNEIDLIVKEAIALTYMGIFLLLAGDDRFWYSIEKHLTVMFYLAAVLIFLYYKTPALRLDSAGSTQDLWVAISQRNSNTIGSDLRTFIAPGLLLGMWGLVRRSAGMWTSVQILALLVLFACDVGLFTFRSSAVFIAIALLSFLLLRPILERSNRLNRSAILLLMTTLALGYYFNTGSWGLLRGRIVGDTEAGGLFDARSEELSECSSQLGWRALIGNGLGSTFDASTLFRGKPGATTWPTLHYGILVLVLKGGVPLILVFLGFLRPGVARRDRLWYRNPCNLTAVLLFPVYLLQLTLNPITLGADSLMANLPAMMVLARFPRKCCGEKPLGAPNRDGMRGAKRTMRVAE